MINWLKQILTGKDGETVAIGRVLGLSIFVLFLIVGPTVGYLAVRLDQMSAEDFGMFLDKIPNYVTMISLSVAGLVGLTSMSEPPHQDR